MSSRSNIENPPRQMISDWNVITLKINWQSLKMHASQVMLGSQDQMFPKCWDCHKCYLDALWGPWDADRMEIRKSVTNQTNYLLTDGLTRVGAGDTCVTQCVSKNDKQNNVQIQGEMSSFINFSSWQSLAIQCGSRKFVPVLPRREICCQLSCQLLKPFCGRF